MQIKRRHWGQEDRISPNEQCKGEKKVTTIARKCWKSVMI